MVAACGAVYLFSGTTFAEQDLRNIVTVLVGVSGTILGFLVAAGALLYAVANTSLVRNLQRTGHFNRLLGDLFVSSGFFFGALGVGVLCLYLPHAKRWGMNASMLELGVQALTFATVLAYLLLIPLGHKMWLLLSNLAPDSASRLE